MLLRDTRARAGGTQWARTLGDVAVRHWHKHTGGARLNMGGPAALGSGAPSDPRAVSCRAKNTPNEKDVQAVVQRWLASSLKAAVHLSRRCSNASGCGCIEAAAHQGHGILVLQEAYIGQTAHIPQRARTRRAQPFGKPMRITGKLLQPWALAACRACPWTPSR
jgi:hypothetical protein